MQSPKCLSRITQNGISAPLLTWTSTMDCWSFSLPAGETCPGAVYGEGKICQSCYAQIGRYNLDAVAKSQWTRYIWARLLMRSSVGRKTFVSTMVDAIDRHATNGYFRVHDSGDFFTVRYVKCWYAICQLLPHIKFWFPTRSHTLYDKPRGLDWRRAIVKLGNLPNVVVRPSALEVNEIAPQIRGMALGSGVLTEQNPARNMCAKSVNGGTCQTNECRHCWISPHESVYYLVHGHLGRHIASDINAGKFPALRKQNKEKFVELLISAR